jgi:hypothetical protein
MSPEIASSMACRCLGSSLFLPTSFDFFLLSLPLPLPLRLRLRLAFVLISWRWESKWDRDIGFFVSNYYEACPIIIYIITRFPSERICSNGSV